MSKDCTQISDTSQVAPANPAQVTDAMKSFAIYSIEDDEDSICFSTGGIEIACCGANSPQGIALLKLDASVRAAIGAGGQAVGYEPCGGCGEKNPDKRCIGCLHPFSALSQPHPADERVVEGLREAADRFDEIRVILIKHLDEPERTAFWKAVNGREFCRHALATEGRKNG